MSDPGYVYIVAGRNTAYIKVGKTTKLARRLQDIAQGVPFPLDLLYAALVHDMNQEETILKQRFAEFRSRGEWFEVPEDVLAQWPLSALPFPGIQHEVRIPQKDRPRKPLPERILRILQDRGCLTARDLCRCIAKVTSSEMKNVLDDLIHNDVLRKAHTGKTTLYYVQCDDRQEVL